MRNLQHAEKAFHNIRLILDDLEKCRVGSETSLYYLEKLKAEVYELELVTRDLSFLHYIPNTNKMGPV